MELKLNDQQEYASKKAQEWYLSKSKQVFEISGPAGSGKTTIVKNVVESLGLEEHEVLFAAFVGKAAMQLARNGNNAKTIHSTIYHMVEEEMKDECGKPVIMNNRPVTKPVFKLKEQLEGHIKLLVIDEGGMINDAMAVDLKSFGIPILVLGDLNQLPPVFGKSAFLKNPDVILTKVMRQKKDSSIIQLSQAVLQGYNMECGDYGDVLIINKEQVSDELLKNVDVIICGRNATRDNLNKYIREKVYGITEKYPLPGEKIICRQNDWKKCICDDIFLINGMVGIVEEIYKETYNGRTISLDFRPDFLEYDYFKKLAIDHQYLFMNQEQKSKMGKSYYSKFEFGYAITCHLSQGSQYDTVLLFNERMGAGDYYRKWLYTAVTRAKKKLIIAI